MNKLLNGRPQWSNWGGLNDLQRNQAFTRGVSPNENTFGDIAGLITLPCVHLPMEKEPEFLMLLPTEAIREELWSVTVLEL